MDTARADDSVRPYELCRSQERVRVANQLEDRIGAASLCRVRKPGPELI
jgi:hypothetical protein